MPVKYIDVAASSDLFVPATRAYGDIAIVGKGRAGTPLSAPTEFTDPSTAAATYPIVRSVTDAVLNSTTTVTSATAAFVAADVGRPVTGTGIPNGTTISAVTNATTITLSAAATATATGRRAHLRRPATSGEHRPRRRDRYRFPADARRPPRIWGVQVDATTPDWDGALAAGRQPQRADRGAGEYARSTRRILP